MELFSNSHRLSSPHLHIHPAPCVFQTRDFLHEDSFEARFVVPSRTACDYVWNRDRSAFSSVRKCSDLAGSLAERLHRKGGTRNVGELRLNTATMGGNGVCIFG